MRKITSSEEANQYYEMVNKLIDKYIHEWKIKPSSLSKYLKPGNPKFESFISNNNLSDIEGIKRIIQDVIEDRKHMELDGVLTFEGFKGLIKESIIEIEKPSVNHEKAIADFFNTSLGHIELSDAEKHIYEVSDFGDKFKCMIYSSEELKTIHKKLEDDSYKSFCEKSIVIDNFTPYVYLKGSDIVSEEKFRESYSKELTEEKLVKIVTGIAGATYKKEFKGYHIWTL